MHFPVKREIDNFPQNVCQQNEGKSYLKQQFQN